MTFNLVQCLNNSRCVYVGKGRLWFLENTDQIATIKLGDTFDPKEEPTVNRDFQVLQKISYFCLYSNRVYMVSEDGMICIRSAYHATCTKKVFRIREKEIFTTITAIDRESCLLASASKTLDKNEMKSTIYLLGKRLNQRASLILDSTTKLVARIRHFNLDKTALNPIHAITPLIFKNTNIVILANYYEFVSLAAIEKGAKLYLICRLTANKQEMHGCMLVSKKMPEYLIYGNECAKTYRICAN